MNVRAPSIGLAYRFSRFHRISLCVIVQSS
nr:MAG TPA: hypothetical protein [Bacteriophage sp.]